MPGFARYSESPEQIPFAEAANAGAAQRVEKNITMIFLIVLFILMKDVRYAVATNVDVWPFTVKQFTLLKFAFAQIFRIIAKAR
ncbi:hypothetical protein DXT88_19495 [Herbaspirillum lusitanum]|nr:hypothetical protein [Herbaspirillum lusitanum]